MWDSNPGLFDSEEGAIREQAEKMISILDNVRGIKEKVPYQLGTYR